MQQPADQAPFATVPMDIPPLTTLSPREREVAALVAEGLSNAEIARRLVITPGTVANHVAHVMRALGARNRVQVAVWAVVHGLYRSGHPHRSGRAGGNMTDAS